MFVIDSEPMRYSYNGYDWEFLYDMYQVRISPPPFVIFIALWLIRIIKNDLMLRVETWIPCLSDPESWSGFSDSIISVKKILFLLVFNCIPCTMLTWPCLQHRAYEYVSKTNHVLYHYSFENVRIFPRTSLNNV